MMRTSQNAKFIVLNVASMLNGVVIGSSGLMTTLAWQATSLQAAAVNPQEHTLDANLYMQTAAEYQAVCLQTYNLATERLRQKLAATHHAGAPPAVVMDLDETVLDNSAFQSFLDRDKLNHSDALWGIWERDFPQEVGLIPGAKAFIEAAEQLGATVVYLSNRDEKLRNSTIAALRQNGLSLEGIDNRLLLKTTTSDKTERRKIAEGRFNALIYLGDNLRDFSEEFKAPQLASNDKAGQKKAIAERADRVRRANYHWGNDWFILPNPVYGEWQRLCGDNPRGKLKVTAMKQVGQFNAIH
jgi:5'-nucleotidase (lipoprotein e(P4) family)